MALQVYNTMHRTKEVFEPLVPGRVSMYVCGPTVYSYIHIGNARPVIFFDVVRRYLEYSGYEVDYVSNFTDVDDKMIRRAQEEGTSVPEVAERYIGAFLEDTAALGVHEARYPRVTENMQEIIQFIQGLVDKDYAYESGGDVFFRTLRFKDYGKLSKQNLEELQFGIRIEVDERKQDAEDFVLWKAAKPGEIAWSSPWGEGRPGWHIECSAMAKKYLGDTIDIHGGGQDLQFPHHECEVAQSEALNERPLARYWMHNGYLNLNNEKMSKSIGNVLNVRDLLAVAKSEEFRYVILSTHYRNPLNYNDEVLAQARGGLERLNNAAANLEFRLGSAVEGDADLEASNIAAKAVQQFREKMDDDFNTPDALTALFELATEANKYMQRADVTTGSVRVLLDAFHSMNEVLGILKAASDEEQALEDLGLSAEQVEALLVERAEARKNKNWARADEIRDLLTEKGIILEDTPQGMRWRRK